MTDFLWPNLFQKVQIALLYFIGAQIKMHSSQTLELKHTIRTIPDFPKKGILFYDTVASELI